MVAIGSPQLSMPVTSSALCHNKKISKLEIPPAVHKWSQNSLSLLPVQKTSTSMWCFTSWVCLGFSRLQGMSSNFHDLAAHLDTTWFHFHSDVDPLKISFCKHRGIWDSQGENNNFMRFQTERDWMPLTDLVQKTKANYHFYNALFPTSCSCFTKGFLEAECCLSGQQFYSFLTCTFVWTTVIDETAKYD